MLVGNEQEESEKTPLFRFSNTEKIYSFTKKTSSRSWQSRITLKSMEIKPYQRKEHLFLMKNSIKTYSSILYVAHKNS